MRYRSTKIAKFMWPKWGPRGSCRPLVGPMLVPWTLLSGYATYLNSVVVNTTQCIQYHYRTAHNYSHDTGNGQQTSTSTLTVMSSPALTHSWGVRGFDSMDLAVPFLPHDLKPYRAIVYEQRLSKFASNSWIRNHMNINTWEVIVHPCPNFRVQELFY